MVLKKIIKQSLNSLRANKLRSAFSILGIVIGVAAIVMILSMGQGLKKMVTDEVDAFGPNVLAIAIKLPGADTMSTVRSMAQGVKVTTLSIDDVEDLENSSNFPYIEAVTGQAFGQEWVTYGGNEKRTMLYGCSYGFPEVVKTMQVDYGRFFNEKEERGLEKVVVIGSGLEETLFNNKNPIGEKVKIKGQNFKVIGVMKPYSGISGGMDINGFVFLPLRTILKTILGINYVSEIDVLVRDSSYINQAVSDITRLMRRNHNIKDASKDDFQIMTMTEILNQVNQISLILNLLLGFLAAISLLVGGIGIMNIMLVSVSERTREIGLRKALGATSKDILYQFLIEALVITGLGGAIGVLTGIINSLLIGIGIKTQALSTWPITISWLAISIGFSISVMIGLVFGIWPAKKAAALDPIRAIRKE